MEPNLIDYILKITENIINVETLAAGVAQPSAIMVQWNLSVTTNSMTRFITSNLFQ